MAKLLNQLAKAVQARMGGAAAAAKGDAKTKALEAADALWRNSMPRCSPERQRLADLTPMPRKRHLADKPMRSDMYGAAV